MPMLLYMALIQTLPLIERLLASSLPGGVLSHMAYAAKLNNLPVMVVATSLTTALFPGMAQQAQSPDPASLAATIRQGLASTTLLIAPIAAWLISCAALVVPVVFGRGSFTSADSAATAQLLSIYAAGLLPLALSVLLARAFYSKRETWPPIIAGAACVATYIALGSYVAQGSKWGAPGLALAMTISSWIGFLLLLVMLLRLLTTLKISDLLADSLPRIVAATIAGTACWSLQPFWSRIGQVEGRVAQVGVLAALTIAGGATYLAAYRLLRTSSIVPNVMSNLEDRVR
jgi:putative peptidoglycan lipid II flippase